MLGKRDTMRYQAIPGVLYTNPELGAVGETEDSAKAKGMDEKLAHGSCLTRPYAIATVTVPRTQPITEYGRRLDAAIRVAGFAPLRLDLAQDRAFAASNIPLGVCLTREGVS